MEIKPLHDTETITFLKPVQAEKKVKSKIIIDPRRQIAAGIYQIIHWEKIKHLSMTILFSITLIFAFIWMLTNGLYWKSGWASYVIPLLLAVVSITKIMTSQLDKNALIRAVKKYRQDLMNGLTSAPPFIHNIYLKLIKNQVSSNWIVFIFIFYFGLFTLILWGLKNVDWYFLHFKKWIADGFKDTKVVIIISVFLMIGIIFIHLLLLMYRKKRIVEIEIFFGAKLMSIAQIEEIKKEKNKFYRRVFLFSVLIILVLPILILAIIKLVRKRK